MYGYKPSLEIEPTNSYEKAKQNITKAVISIKSLPYEQQKQIAKELLGPVKYRVLLSLLRAVRM